MKQTVEATSESNTADNWAKIIAICEKADSSESEARETVAALTRRIAHKNVNVVLFSLTVANSLVQNCGISVKREVASRAFLDTLVRQITNTTGVRKVIRNRVLELIQQWTEAFKGIESLDYMGHVYERIKSDGVEFPVPNGRPATPKRNSDKDREEEELQLALALSLSEHDKKSRAQNSQPKSGQSPKPAQVLFQVCALYDFHGTEEGELHLTRGDIVDVYDCTTFQDWWKGSLRGTLGIFPSNYVEKVADGAIPGGHGSAIAASSAHHATVNQDPDAIVLSQRTFILDFNDRVSRVDPRRVDYTETDRLQSDYNRIIELRPQVIKSATSYRQKQDDLTALSERFLKAQNSFHAMMQAHVQYQHQAATAAASSYGGHGPPGTFSPAPPPPAPQAGGAYPPQMGPYPYYAHGPPGTQPQPGMPLQQQHPYPMQHMPMMHPQQHMQPMNGGVVDPHGGGIASSMPQEYAALQHQPQPQHQQPQPPYHPSQVPPQAYQPGY